MPRRAEGALKRRQLVKKRRTEGSFTHKRGVRELRGRGGLARAGIFFPPSRASPPPGSSLFARVPRPPTPSPSRGPTSMPTTQAGFQRARPRPRRPGRALALRPPLPPPPPSPGATITARAGRRCIAGAAVAALVSYRGGEAVEERGRGIGLWRCIGVVGRGGEVWKHREPALIST